MHRVGQLVAHVRARVAPDEKRTIECRMPRIRREFDKTTGQALQAPAI